MTSSTADLTCVSCGQEVPHELVFAGRLLHSTRCTHCGHVVRHEQRDLMSTYLRDLEHRLLTKPQRMVRRAWREPTAFLLSLPGAVLRQPAKLVDELLTVFRQR